MVLQRYRAKQELGKGSFGTVYLTEGRRDKKAYVVKVVDNLQENNLKVQEIRVMMHLRHRNIVEMCDFYTSNNQLCIVMGYADGGDLRSEVIKARNGKTTISEELISVWLIQVCQALDYAHEEQIIHRDIKPSNIFLMADGNTVKVGDFGISKVLDAASGANQVTAAEADGGRVGTKRYMAPEILNRKDYSNKADIWSLGCVLFELLTLNHPTYEQDRRIWFEWIPGIYSSNIREVCQQCLSENAMLRPSPKELIVKLAGPFLSAPLVQQEFYNAMQWYDTKLAESRSLFEHQADLIRQFFPNYHVPVPATFAQGGRAGGGSESSSMTISVFPASDHDKVVSRSDALPSRSAIIVSSLYASQSSSKVKPEAPLSDSSRDLRKSQSGVQKENLPPLRASMSAIEHFNIPEYTEDEPVSKLNSPEIAMVSKENIRVQRSAAPPLPSADTSRPNVLSSASQYEQSAAPLQQTILASHPLPSVSGAQQPHARNEIEPVGYVSHSAQAAGYAANGVQGDWQSTVDSYQRQQEVSMRASFGVQAISLAHSAEKPMVGMEYGDYPPSQHALAESFVTQQQVQPQGYGLQHLQQTVPNHLSSYQQSSLYSSASAPHPQQHMQQQHQPYDLYSSHNSMHSRSQSMINPSIQSTQPSLYASLQNSGSAGPMQQQTQGYQPQMQTYAHQTPHSMQQPMRPGGGMGNSFDGRSQYTSVIDTRQSAPALPNPNSLGQLNTPHIPLAPTCPSFDSTPHRTRFETMTKSCIPGMRGSFDQANLPQHNANNLGMRSSFDQASMQQHSSMRGSFESSARGNFEQSSMQQHQHQNHTNQQASLRASFDQYNLQQLQQQQQQQPNLRSSYDSVGLQSQFNGGSNYGQQNSNYTPTLQQTNPYNPPSSIMPNIAQPNIVASTRASFDTASHSRLHSQHAAGISLSPSLSRDTLHSAPTAAASASAAATSLRSGEGDTSKVLEELERVRHGIQATLAAAVARGGVNSAASTPKVTTSATPQSSHQPLPNTSASTSPPSSVITVQLQNQQQQEQLQQEQQEQTQAQPLQEAASRFSYAEM